MGTRLRGFLCTLGRLVRLPLLPVGMAFELGLWVNAWIAALLLRDLDECDRLCSLASHFPDWTWYFGKQSNARPHGEAVADTVKDDVGTFDRKET